VSLNVLKCSPGDVCTYRPYLAQTCTRQQAANSAERFAFKKTPGAANELSAGAANELSAVPL